MQGRSDKPARGNFKPGESLSGGSLPRWGSKPAATDPSDAPRSDRPRREKPAFSPRTDAPRTESPRRERPVFGNSRTDNPRSESPRRDRPAFGERSAPRGDRPAFGDRSGAPRGDRPAFGARSEAPRSGPRRDKPAFGDRPAPRSAAPRAERSDSERRSARTEFNKRSAPSSFDTTLQHQPEFGGQYAAPRARRPESKPSRAPAAQDSEDYNEPQKAVGGFAAVEALLKSKPGIVHRVLFKKDSGEKRLFALQKIVKHLHIHHQQLDAAQLDEHILPNQGVVALCHEQEVSTWESVRTGLFAALESGEPRTVAVIVNIEDPRNLGACLRSALALKVDVVLIPTKGMCGLTPLAARASAGALSQLTLCRPDNLEGALGELVAAGYDLLGLDDDTPDSVHDMVYKAHTIIAVGGEDRELPPFIRKQCTKVLRIPMVAEAHSYNASVALTLALYERARSTQFGGMLVDPVEYAAKKEAERKAFFSPKEA